MLFRRFKRHHISIQKQNANMLSRICLFELKQQNGVARKQETKMCYLKRRKPVCCCLRGRNQSYFEFQDKSNLEIHIQDVPIQT